MTRKPIEKIAQAQTHPAVRREYSVEGKKVVVVRHFMEDKDLQSIVLDLAIGRAKREMGL